MGEFKDFLNLIAREARAQDVTVLQATAEEWRSSVRSLVLRQFALVATVSLLAI